MGYNKDKNYVVNMISHHSATANIVSHSYSTLANAMYKKIPGHKDSIFYGGKEDIYVLNRIAKQLIA